MLKVQDFLKCVCIGGGGGGLEGGQQLPKIITPFQNSKKGKH